MPKKQHKNENIDGPMVEQKYPDGGWGWIIVLATGISNFINIPVMQSFALIFKNRIEQLNMSTTDLTTIINVNAAFGMSLGLITGPLLKKLGFRKVALFGAFSSFIGITSTSWATTFIDFLVTYSLITSMGTFLLMSAFGLAINTYFRERRGYASGMSTTLTGLGPVVMPQLITFLLYHYDTTGTTMILGALSLHSVMAALLLQPVKWHMKTCIITPEVDQLEEEDLLKQKNDKTATGETRRRNFKTSTSVDQETEFDSYSLYGFETPLVAHRRFGSSQQLSRKRKSWTPFYQRSISQNDDVPDEIISKRLSIINKANSNSGETVNLGSSVKIFDEKMYHQLSQVNFDDANGKEKRYSKNLEERDIKTVSICDQKGNNFSSANDDSTQDLSNEEKKNLCKGCLKSTVAFFDLDLLKDPTYVILMLGMSLAICAELNFSLFTPLILGDFGFSLQQIATFMSLVAAVDIVFRFLAPFIGDKLNLAPQTMYLISLVMLIASRTSLMIFHDYGSAITVAIGLGIAKGFRTVYMSLVIPAHVPLDRLPSANGIQSVVNCVFIVLSIPLMSAVRDKTGSFNMCIGALNCITLVTVCMWTTQLICKRLKNSTSNTSVEDEV